MSSKRPTVHPSEPCGPPSGLEARLFPGTDADIAAAYSELPAEAAGASWGFESETVYLDVETTGFDPERDAIIEVAALIARGPEVVGRFSSLVDPGRPVPLSATQLTGIDEHMLRGAPPISSVIAEVAAFAGGRDIVAHNAAFDRAFITRAAARVGVRVGGLWLDSLELSRIGLPRLASHRLGDIADAFGLHAASHRAADDVEALFGVWRVALAGAARLGPDVLGRIAAVSPGTEWPLRGVLRQLAASGRPGTADLKRLRAERVRHRRAASLADADGRGITHPTAEEVAGAFAADGAVGRMYPGFEARSEQLRMAEAVRGAFEEGRHVAVEAGTGVGKSVAYLVPAAMLALRSSCGVGVASKTNTLMDQLVYNELPALARELGGGLRFTALRGYEHYPCLRKLDALTSSSSELSAADLADVSALLAWVAQSSWGDLHAVNVHWGPLAARVRCSVEDCTRKRCRFFPDLCYLHGARRLAGSAHIVVTNHALLFRDAAASGQILPPLRYWVVDEAHAAESEARRQMSAGADHRALLGLLGRLHAPRRPGVVDAARSRGRNAAIASGHDEVAQRIDSLAMTLRSECETAATVTGSFFALVKDVGAAGAEGGYDLVQRRLTTEVRDAGPWGHAARVGTALSKRLSGIIASGRELISALEEAGEETVEARADLTGVLTGLAEQLAALDTIVDGLDDSFVYSVRVSRRPDDDRDAVEAALLDVGAMLAERFFPETHAVVFTSATIATGEDFSHLARTIGLDRLGEGAWSSLRLDSSYDFERQMAALVATDLPERGGSEYVARMARLLEGVHVAMGGSVLTLWTNVREMGAVHEIVAPALEARGLRVLLQERGAATKRVRDEFVSDERLSLFATKSFWEGFDAPGDTLRCVVIARLPFGRVDDPLYEERRDRLGRRAWDDFYLPEAVLELKQAAGRLIRSSTDEGCVIIADARIAGTKGYARSFLGALPVSGVEMLPTEELIARVRERFGR